MAHELVSIGTMNPAVLKKQLQDPKSSFFKNSGLTPESSVVAQLMRLADSTDPDVIRNDVESFNVHTAQNLGLDNAILKSLGRGVDDLWLMSVVKDSKGEERLLDGSEFIAWQNSIKALDGKSELAHGGRPGEAPDEWAQRINMPLKSFADEHFALHMDGPKHLQGTGRRTAGNAEAGGQNISIENPTGTQRIVAAGRILTEPFGLNYGNERILDAAPNSPTKGKPILVGKDGELDIFLTDEVLSEITGDAAKGIPGKPYTGAFMIKSRGELQGDTEVCDPKVFYLNDPQAAIIGEAKGFGGPKHLVSELSHVKFNPPVELPDSFVKYDERDKASYAPMTSVQYQAWKFDLSENAEARTMRPEKWIDKKWGSREIFENALKDFEKNGVLTRDQYHKAIEDSTLQKQVKSMPKLSENAYDGTVSAGLPAPLATGVGQAGKQALG